jgi:hypothetical protein
MNDENYGSQQAKTTRPELPESKTARVNLLKSVAREAEAS